MVSSFIAVARNKYMTVLESTFKQGPVFLEGANSSESAAENFSSMVPRDDNNLSRVGDSAYSSMY